MQQNEVIMRWQQSVEVEKQAPALHTAGEGDTFVSKVSCEWNSLKLENLLHVNS